MTAASRQIRPEPAIGVGRRCGLQMRVLPVASRRVCQPRLPASANSCRSTPTPRSVNGSRPRAVGQAAAPRQHTLQWADHSAHGARPESAVSSERHCRASAPARGGKQNIGGQKLHCLLIEQPGTVNAGVGEDDRIKLAFTQFAKAGVDVAAKRNQLQIRTGDDQLAPSPHAACGDARPLWKCIEFGAVGGDQHVRRKLRAAARPRSQVCLAQQAAR